MSEEPKNQKIDPLQSSHVEKIENSKQRTKNIQEMVLAGLDSPVSKNNMDDIFEKAVNEVNTKE